jgi:predicted DNA binding CopG/RHH family protein
VSKYKKIIVDLSKPESEREVVLDFTPEEEAQLDLEIAENEKLKEAEMSKQQKLQDLKASAKAKLIAGEPLTEEEASVLVI